MTSGPSLCVTVDTDWAPDPVLADTLQLLTDLGVRATIFATNPSRCYEGLPADQFEMALHPNLNWAPDGSGTNFRHAVDSLRQAFPDSVGMRSHSLTQGAQLLDYLVSLGFVYDSNYFLPFPARAFVDWNGLVRVPFSFSDIWQAFRGGPFTLEGAGISGRGEVVAFHPVHVFLNTEDVVRYDANRGHLSETDRLSEGRNRGPVPGTRDLLEELGGASFEFFTSLEIAERAKSVASQ